MKLKTKYKTQEEIPEAYRGLYQEEGGEWVLVGVDGVVPKEKADEYRTNNIDLLKQIAALKDQYGNIDPKKYQELLDSQKKLEEENLKSKGQFDELERRLREAHTQQMGERDKIIDSLKRGLKERVIDSVISAHVDQVGVLKPGNMRFLLADARGAFDIEDFDKILSSGDLSKLDEKIFCRGEDGKPRFGKEAKPITPKDWMLEYFQGAGKGLLGDTKGFNAPGGGVLPVVGSHVPISALQDGMSGDMLAKIASGEVTAIPG